VWLFVSIVGIIAVCCVFAVYCVLFDSRTNLRGEGGVCNDLWLQLITVSLCDEVIPGMYMEKERNGQRNAC
jgi:hypothetical protein